MIKAEKSKNFYIFRHGECPYNVTGHIQGQTHDGDLTVRGRMQAHQTGKRLEDKKIEIIISSPLRRARQTAQIVSLYLKVPIWVDNRLKEVNMGIAEGMHISQIEKQFPELYEKWRNCTLEDKTTHFEKGETKAQVRKRIFEALDHYAYKTDFQNIAVAGHGITISQTLLTFGIRQSDIPNGSIVRITNQNHQWSYEGFVEH